MDVNNIHFTALELKIVRYIFKHYKDKHNARQLARILRINHAHTNKLCGLLVKKRLLISETIGNATYFSFSYNNKLSIKFMQYLLGLEEQLFPKWLSIVLYNLKRFSQHISFGAIFGSSVNNNNFNDVDVLLVYDKNKIKDIKKIKDEIIKSQLIEQPIRYVEITEDDVMLNKDSKTFYNIFSNNLIFYNAEKYVEVIKKCHK
ncbi:hypothetical protein COV18_04635 [Candidatus Woesearchaeota archaeon CG10_big_fil_rev_8_21_14_0_10_37_12]|nr:MAG: hypothetical protein COV18_04635 [Candidatus Woesearchaeota archaeon CG10_big_fil_rev_8_21_14_0_10_37_12]